MSGYCVRITEYPNYGDRITALTMTTDYESILSFHHKGATGENPHYHLVIRTQCKLKAFRARFVKIFDLGKGNEHMSIKPWDGDNEAYSYMFHESPDGKPYLQYKVSDEQVEEYRQMNKKIQQLVVQAKGKASYHLEQIVLDLLEKGHHYSDFTIGCMVIREAMVRDKYHPNDFQLRSIIDRIQFKRHELDSNEQTGAIENIVRRALRMN